MPRQRPGSDVPSDGELERPAPEPEAQEAGAVEVAEPQAEARPIPGPAAQAELEDLKAKYLRLAADFDNFKKRARQEQTETVRFAAQRVAERLLTVLDGFHLALSHVPEATDREWLKGVELAVARLEDELSELGVEAIAAVGMPFDPGLHEAIGSEESQSVAEDTVLEELRAGYTMHGRVLRPSLVKVARKGA